MKNSPPRKPESEVKEDHNHDLEAKATHEQDIDQLALYQAVRRWTAYRLSSFRDWDFDEIVNEAYLHAHDLVRRKYRTDRGSISTFLRSRLYSPVAARYQEANDIQVARPYLNGKLGPRQYEQRVHVTIRRDVHEDKVEEKATLEPGWLEKLQYEIGEVENEIVSLIMRSWKPTEIRDHLGISYHVYRKCVARIRACLAEIIGES
jgi:hypothetical protein